MVQLIWLHIDPRRQDKMSIEYAWGKKKSEFDTNFKVLVPKYYSALLVPCQVRHKWVTVLPVVRKNRAGPSLELGHISM